MFIVITQPRSLSTPPVGIVCPGPPKRNAIETNAVVLFELARSCTRAGMILFPVV